MAQASVRFRLPDGQLVRVGPGAVIGRLATAALRIPDASLSEAHALVTLRGPELKLLALRGAVRTGGDPVAEVTLRAGQRIHLTREVTLEVVAVELPDELFRVEGGESPVELVAPVWAVHADPPRLVAGHDPAARAHLFDDGEGWVWQSAGGPTRLLVPDDRLPGTPFVLRRVPLAQGGAADTVRPGQFRLPVRLVARYATVHLHRPQADPRVIDGLPARILTELVRFDAPARWEWVARELWGADVELPVLRVRWDRGMRRLRAALQEAGAPPELLRVDGSGNVELVLGPDDEVVDES